jgi:hypothetical protein
MKRFLLVAVLAVASSTWADVLPPNLLGCQSRQAGASCKMESGEAGTCQPSTCSRNDYSNGIPPSVVDYECLLCTASAAPAPEPATAPTPAPAPAPAAVQEVSPLPEKKSTSCAAMPGAPLALGLVLVGGLARRRKRSA